VNHVNVFARYFCLKRKSMTS